MTYVFKILCFILPQHNAIYLNQNHFSLFPMGFIFFSLAFALFGKLRWNLYCMWV